MVGCGVVFSSIRIVRFILMASSLWLRLYVVLLHTCILILGGLALSNANCAGSIHILVSDNYYRNMYLIIHPIRESKCVAECIKSDFLFILLYCSGDVLLISPTYYLPGVLPCATADCRVYFKIPAG